MKKISLFALVSGFLLLMLSSCCKTEEENTCQKKGQIISYVYIECMCCPGWVISTGNDTIKAEILPDEEKIWKIIETSGYPVNIMFDYNNITGVCSERYKKITCLKIL
ncbi:MAG: hypothetical protein ACM3PT_12785 [Deltaproteobacteria bacterium]